jgi:ABC-2 type transport system permease protein
MFNKKAMNLIKPEKIIKPIIISTRIAGFAFIDELKAILSDNGALIIFFLAMIAYPVVYSIGYKNNLPYDIPIAIVDNDNTTTSRQLSRMLDATQQMEIKKVADAAQAENLFWEGTVKGMVVIPKGFEKNIFKCSQAEIGLFCDAGYFLVYKETLNGSIQALGTFSAGVEIKQLLSSGVNYEEALKQRQPFRAELNILYNPAGAYGSYVMPGIILLLIQQTLLIGIGMIGGAGRENNNNRVIVPGVTLRSGPFSVVIGKSLAYFIIYFINLIFCLLWIYRWFDFPAKGSLANVVILLVPYMFSVIFLGLGVSLLFKKREHSIMVMVFLSPIILFLSGMSWPASSLPEWLYFIAHLFPSTSMIPAYLRIRTMGVDLSSVKAELLFLIGQMVVYYLLTCQAYKYLARKHAITG